MVKGENGMKTIYVAHPFRGNKDKNRMDAKEQCVFLKEQYPDYCFINPLDAFSWADGFPDEGVLEMCKAVVIRCDAIFMCKGWDDSAGCQAELHTALMAGLEVMYE